MKYNPGISRSLAEVLKILGFDIVKCLNNNVSNSISIVDIGCGVGRSLWELSEILSNKKKLNLTGYFYSETPKLNEMFYKNHLAHLDVAKYPKKLAKSFNIDVTKLTSPILINNDVTKNIPLESNTVDFIYSVNAFHYFKDKLNALKEISRILKVGGIAILNIDRTDGGFWDDSISLSRIKIYQNDKLVDIFNYFAQLNLKNFKISLKKVDSYGMGKDTYIMKIEKLYSGELNFDEFIFEENNSTSLEVIRSSNINLENNLLIKELAEKSYITNVKLDKKYFGGYLSVYRKIQKSVTV